MSCQILKKKVGWPWKYSTNPTDPSDPSNPSNPKPEMKIEALKHEDIGKEKPEEGKARDLKETPKKRPPYKKNPLQSQARNFNEVWRISPRSSS